MDSAAFLDLLGNENRRRILRLLARKPCYVTEISDYLGVSPKAVIDHLRKLDDAGLVESHVDDGRRKYFSIARNLRLEVNVSPYDFGTKSAYSASPNLDITSCQYVSIDVERTRTVANDADLATDGESDLTSLAADLRRLERLENELSMAQRWVQRRLTETLDEITAEFEGVDGRFYGELLRGLAIGPATPDDLSRRVEAPPGVVVDALEGLSAHGVVERDGDEWLLSA
ncbi:MarR family transcriptional regulator [Halobacteriales archaeon SW_12_69_24]|jgi:ArsR family transcriptional regulator|nr:MAG: MarR family transcriptional regulator [Halobacteriales archaeon SW_12_69_24]